MPTDPIADQTLPTRGAAERVATILGCTGAHQVGDAWQPCESNEELLTLVNEGVAGYRKLRSRKLGVERRKNQAKRVITSRPIREDSKRKRKKRRRWEQLGEQPRSVIFTSPPGV